MNSTETHTAITTNDVDRILNATADELSDDYGLPRDALNLFVNVAIERLANPDITVEAAITQNWDPEDEDESDADIVDRVIGWATSQD